MVVRLALFYLAKNHFLFGAPLVCAGETQQSVHLYLYQLVMVCVCVWESGVCVCECVCVCVYVCECVCAACSTPGGPDDLYVSCSANKSPTSSSRLSRRSGWGRGYFIRYLVSNQWTKCPVLKFDPCTVHQYVHVCVQWAITVNLIFLFVSVLVMPMYVATVRTDITQPSLIL